MICASNKRVHSPGGGKREGRPASRGQRSGEGGRRKQPPPPPGDLPDHPDIPEEEEDVDFEDFEDFEALLGDSESWQSPDASGSGLEEGAAGSEPFIGQSEERLFGRAATGTARAASPRQFPGSASHDDVETDLRDDEVDEDLMQQFRGMVDYGGDATAAAAQENDQAFDESEEEGEDLRQAAMKYDDEVAREGGPSPARDVEYPGEGDDGCVGGINSESAPHDATQHADVADSAFFDEFGYDSYAATAVDSDTDINDSGEVTQNDTRQAQQRADRSPTPGTASQGSKQPSRARGRNYQPPFTKGAEENLLRQIRSAQHLEQLLQTGQVRILETGNAAI